MAPSTHRAENFRVTELSDARIREGHRFRVKRNLSIAALLQILTIIVSAIYFAGRFEHKIEQMISEQQKQGIVLERIEKYLSSHDSHYWQAVRAMEETGK